MRNALLPASLLLASLTVVGAEADSLRPRNQILSTLRTNHPRLLASESDFSRLKQQVGTDAALRSWRASLDQRAQRILDEEPSRYEIPDGLRLLSTSRRVLDRVYTLALLYRLNPDQRFLDRTWKELEAAAGFPDWNPKHFLDTAEMTHAFAIAYDWLFDSWSPEQRTLLKNAIVQKGLEPGLKTYRANTGWSQAIHNWNQVCNGGMGMGALAIAEVEPEIAAEVLEGAIRSLPLAMAEFAPDGAWSEGPGYWNYATSYNVAILAALESALGTDFGLSKQPGFAETGLFPLYLTGPIGRTFNYADGGDATIRAPQMFWLARKFDQPVYAWYEQRVASPSAQDLVWYLPAARSPDQVSLPLAKYFRGSGIVTLRSSWEDTNSLFVAFKAGDNKANHSHLDLGMFVLDAHGVRWAMDLGAENYNLPGYFGGNRWTYYRLRAEGQNTLVINPGEGPDQDPRAAATITRFDSKPERAFAVADLTAAYSKSAKRVQRGVALIGGKQVMIQDELETPNPPEVWWFLHTKAATIPSSDGRGMVLEQGNAKLYATLLSPAEARFEVLGAQPLDSSPNPDGQSRNEGIRKLAIHLTETTNQRITVVFTQEPNSKEAMTTLVRPLSEW